MVKTQTRVSQRFELPNNMTLSEKLVYISRIKKLSSVQCVNEDQVREGADLVISSIGFGLTANNVVEIIPVERILSIHAEISQQGKAVLENGLNISQKGPKVLDIKLIGNSEERLSQLKEYNRNLRL